MGNFNDAMNMLSMEPNASAEDISFYYDVRNVSNEKFYFASISEEEGVNGVRTFLEGTNTEVTDFRLHHGYSIFEKLRSFLKAVASSELSSMNIALKYTQNGEEKTSEGSFLDILQTCVDLHLACYHTKAPQPEQFSNKEDFVKAYDEYESKIESMKCELSSCTVVRLSNLAGESESHEIFTGSVECCIQKLIYTGLIVVKHYEGKIGRVYNIFHMVPGKYIHSEQLTFERETSFFYSVEHECGRWLARELSLRKLKKDYYGDYIFFLLKGWLLDTDD